MSCACFETETQQRHPHFVCLFQLDQTESRISICTNPLLRERQLNGLAPGARVATGAPNWKLELVIGPFATGSGRIKQLWVKHRTLECRMVAGLNLATTVKEGVAPDSGISVSQGQEVIVYYRDVKFLNRVMSRRKSQLSKRLKL